MFQRSVGAKRTLARQVRMSLSLTFFAPVLVLSIQPGVRSSVMARRRARRSSTSGMFT